MTADTAERVLTGLLRSLEGTTYVRVATDDGTVVVGRLLPNGKNDSRQTLRVADDNGTPRVIDLSQVADVMATSDVPF